MFFFFFYCSAHHRDLHSFPTRRSSDLQAEIQSSASRPMPHVQASTCSRITDRHTSKRTTRQKDRKSTRLNSSHRTISYAVFCLKKKKQQNTTNLIIPYIPATTNTRSSN